MLRYSCLIIGILLGLLLLSSMITCRLTGFPLAEESGIRHQQTSRQQSQMSGKSIPLMVSPSGHGPNLSSFDKLV